MIDQICLTVSQFFDKLSTLNIECGPDESGFWDLRWDSNEWICFKNSYIYPIGMLEDGTEQNAWYGCNAQDCALWPYDNWEQWNQGFYFEINHEGQGECSECNRDESYTNDWSSCTRDEFFSKY